ncbi:MAG: DJ-1/PfpI family protein [Kiritimatiellae bacterium]|nr:DJ-1/PfpI family protein [Kiritimatiellia bacterium]
MTKVLVPLANGFEDIEAITIIDVLRRGRVEVVTASISDELEVMSAHGVAMKADGLFKDVAEDEYDAVILPGGGEGTENLKRSVPVIERLRRQAEERRLIAAICAAPTVLEVAGVLDRETQVTCYPSCQMELDRPWTSAPVVHDANIITGQAPGTALLFSLVLLQTLEGENAARKVARAMVTDVLY